MAAISRRHFRMYFLERKCVNFIKISLKFVRNGPINNIPALVHIMAWRRPGDKPLSEPMMASLVTHICVTQPQGVKMLTAVHPSICLLKYNRRHDAKMTFYASPHLVTMYFDFYTLVQSYVVI